jgi:hypothetical protein
VQAPEPNKSFSSSGGSTTGDALAWPLRIFMARS